MLKRFLISTTIFLAITAATNTIFAQQNKTYASNSDNYVVVLSLDGFRWDYPAIANTPTLITIAQNGVTVEAFIPCYPTKTFPNHYSMATGLHPDNHGIVLNSFFDQDLGYFAIRNREAVENGAFYGGEPFWVSAEKQGVISATYFWVGSEADVQGVYPSFWKRYDRSHTFEQKIDTVIHWLNLPIENRPRLIAWYSSEPDGTSHSYGPTASETIAVAEELDSLLGVFISRLSELPHFDQINFIVVSDHGMADIYPDKYINLSDYVDRDWFEFITGGNPVYTVQPKEEYYEQAVEALKAIPTLNVWEKHEIPAHLNYGKNPRVKDLLIEAEIGYSVGFRSDGSRYTGGTHGYDNEIPDMHGIFFAQGPAFKVGFRHKAILNLNLYNIITHILGIQPAENDGEWDDIKDLFR